VLLLYKNFVCLQLFYLPSNILSPIQEFRPSPTVAVRYQTVCRHLDFIHLQFHDHPTYLHFCAARNLATDAALALCIGNVGCSSFSHRYLLTAYTQLGSLVYHDDVPLSRVSLRPQPEQKRLTQHTPHKIQSCSAVHASARKPLGP
jgi:hypothetical protein